MILDPLHGASYQFWSGIGSGSPLFAAVAIYLRRHTCHVDRCWRIAKHPVTGTGYITCRKHHPAIGAKVSAANVSAAHQGARAREAKR